MADDSEMAGTNERRERKSIVDEGWEPITPERTALKPLLIGFAVAFLVVPVLAFAATYLLLSR